MKVTDEATGVDYILPDHDTTWWCSECQGPIHGPKGIVVRQGVVYHSEDCYLKAFPGSGF